MTEFTATLPLKIEIVSDNLGLIENNWELED
jgi:hypothetical protein